MSEAMFPRQFVASEGPGFEVSSRGSDTMTSGVRVQVEPRYMAEHSEPGGDDSDGISLAAGDDDESGEGRYVFSYRVRVTNGSDDVVTLLDRHWVITDAEGDVNEVRGPGVVGHRPRLRPGQSFEYESFCPLPTRWGTMEGTYRFQRDPVEAGPGDLFDVVVGRFYLVAEETGGGLGDEGFDDLGGL